MNRQKKRAYVRPTLRTFGSIRNLTGGSSGPGNDGSGGFTGMGGMGNGFGMNM